MHMKLMTCRHHLHLNLTRQGHTIPNNLNMPSLLESASFAYLCAFLAGTRTLAPDPAEETYVELSDTEPEDTVGAATTTYPGKGENLCHYFITFCSRLAVALERCCLILSTLYAMFNNHIAMTPTSQQTIVLLGYR